MKTYEVICANCGNKFTVGRNSRGKKYCSNECKKEALKKQNKKITNKIVRGTRVKVTCEFCGKVEEVTPSRTSKYHACSIQCASKLSSKRYSKKIDTTCAVCGKPLSLKPYRISRLINPAHITCSKKYINKLKETLYLGENNHQFGKRGRENDYFIDKDLVRENHNLTEIFVYNEDLKTRITKHRNLVIENKDKFNPRFFDKTTNPLKPGVQVHHKNLNHDDNRLENLVLLSRAMHTSLHNSIKSISIKTISSIIGVLKQHKLLETDLDLNQQSIKTNIIDSETINVTEIGDKDIVVKNIISKISDYIAQIEDLTNQASLNSLDEFKEDSDDRTNNTDENG